MLKAKFKAAEDTADPLAPSAEFIEAKKRQAEISARHRDLTERSEGLDLAVSMASSPGDSRRVPDALKQRAQPYRKLAQKRPHKVADMIDECRLEFEEFLETYYAETEAWAISQRRETNRIACLLQPAQRAAVRVMASAIESLSQATADERECRAELRRLAPLPESPNLPDLSSGLEVGCLSDWGGPAWRWARQIRKLKILED